VRVSHLNGLLEQGAIDENDYQNRAAALHVASEIITCCANGNSAQLKNVLLENPNLDVNAITENEATPLHIAANAIRSGKSNPKVLEVLLEHRAQVDKKKSGITALLTICEKADFPAAAESARVLIARGADAKTTAPVQGKGKSYSCISAAVSSGGSAALIENLCAGGASPNDTCEPHGPILNHCIIEGYPDQAVVLLSYGADPNSREIETGATCLASAITSGSVSVVKALMQNGANTSMTIMKDQKVTAKELAKYMAASDNSSAVQEIARIVS